MSFDSICEFRVILLRALMRDILGASLGLVLAANAFADGASLTGLGFLPGCTRSEAGKTSADGTVVVGTCWGQAAQAFRWTPSTGMVGLGILPNYTESYAADVSGDGEIVVGLLKGSFKSDYFRWTTEQGMTDFRPELNSIAGNAAISDDGLLIAGSYLTYDLHYMMYRWTLAAGMEIIGPPATFDSLSVTDVSSDGSVIVGTFYNAFGFGFAYRWTASSGFVSLGATQINYSIATGVSADGSVVVGYNYGSPNFRNSTNAFRWTRATGVEFLSYDGSDIAAYDVSADGRVVIGSGSRVAAPFRWTSRTGLLSLSEILTKYYNLDLGGWGLFSAGIKSISGDGSVIAGSCRDPQGNVQACIVRILLQVPAAGHLQFATTFGPQSWSPAVFDPEDDALTCRIAQPPSNGVAVVASDCSSGTYTPQHGFIGTDTFTYTANDGQNDSNPGIVTVAVTEGPLDQICAQNNPVSQFAQTGKEGTLTIRFSGNIVSHTDKVVKLCPGTTLQYTATSTQGPVVCRVKNNTTRDSGSLKINDHIKCTDKPAGKDKVGFKVKSGVK